MQFDVAMDSKPWSIATFFIFSILSVLVHCQADVFTVNVDNANPQADMTQNLLAEWKKACATKGGSMVIQKGNYSLSPVEFLGPCNGSISFVINGNLIAPEAAPPNLEYWIMFRDLNSLSISGTGILDGNGASYWKKKNSPFLSSLKFEAVKNTEVHGITSVNIKKVHLAINDCHNITVKNVHIKAPADSPNTDGIHIGRSENVLVSNLDIGTGDDCISLVQGCTNININGVKCGPGHGISVGSLGRYPKERSVQTITVTNCTLTNTQNGLRIKSFTPSSPSTASNITFKGITVHNVGNPIIIDQHYCPGKQCPGSGQGDSSVFIKGVKFINVQGTSSEAVGVKIACSKTHPCQDIELSGISLTFKGKPTTANCTSANVKFLGTNVPAKC